MRILLASLAAAAALSAPAFSQSMVVVGRSAAAACYHNAVMHQYDRAALNDCNSAFDYAVMNRETRARTHVNRAVLLMNMGQPVSALRDLDAAVALRFSPPEVHLNYSAAYVRLERPHEAVAAATAALDAGIAHPERAYVNRAVAYEMMGDNASAYADYLAALQHDPDWIDVQRELSRFQVANGS
ncbi:MAG: hypothetical protein CMF74_09145 [Maricaulis sp.]|jgi:tetratricopeptide (TPR) repeat protein|nr:hypothetical protein [Maricaulis sp.]HAQ35378.1 hypothetical protein [Alphaproteobacteria bacterium]